MKKSFRYFEISIPINLSLTPCIWKSSTWELPLKHIHINICYIYIKISIWYINIFQLHSSLKKMLLWTDLQGSIYIFFWLNSRLKMECKLVCTFLCNFLWNMEYIKAVSPTDINVNNQINENTVWITEQHWCTGFPSIGWLWAVRENAQNIPLRLHSHSVAEILITKLLHRNSIFFHLKL